MRAAAVVAVLLPKAGWVSEHHMILKCIFKLKNTVTRVLYVNFLFQFSLILVIIDDMISLDMHTSLPLSCGNAK